MARNSRYLEAPPSAVWAVLEDPYAYPKWVVGPDRTLEADATWPAVDSSFRVHLSFGLKDRTTVREVDPGRRIVVDAAAGIFGPARVTIDIGPEGTGTRVVMNEDPVGKVAPLRFLPPVQLAIKLRNVEALRRLARVAASRGRQTRAKAGAGLEPPR